MIDRGRLLAVCLVALMATSARAGVVWDEGVDGDLSNDRLAPDAVSLSVGGNLLIGSVVGGDRDYLTITIPNGAVLSGLSLDAYTSTDDWSFIGIQAGSTFTEPPTGTDPANLLGWVLFGTPNEGTDILDDMGTGDDAIGFIPPLAAGEYTLWIQETSSKLSGYTFNLQVTAVPEASSLAMLAAAGVVAGWWHRRRRSISA